MTTRRWTLACAALRHAHTAMLNVTDPTQLTGPAIALVTATHAAARLTGGTPAPRHLRDEHTAATRHWIELSRRPENVHHVLTWLDPATTTDAPRTALAGLPVPTGQYTTLQLAVTLSLTPADPHRIWTPHHQVLRLTDTAAATLRDGTTANGLHIATGTIETATEPDDRVADTAATLWEPDRDDSSYRTLTAALTAARQLVSSV